MSGRVASLFRPWAGLIIGVLAAAFAHQFGADGSFNDCQRLVPVPILFIAALCVAACLIGAWASLPVLRRGDEQTAQRVVSAISVGFALLAAVAILLPMVGAMILPACFE